MASRRSSQRRDRRAPIPDFDDTDQKQAAIAELQAAKVGAGRPATVTREMIGAAHDVMLAKGDFVLSASMLARIFLAMEAAR